jgi:hypothetical protein
VKQCLSDDLDLKHHRRIRPSWLMAEYGGCQGIKAFWPSETSDILTGCSSHSPQGLALCEGSIERCCDSIGVASVDNPASLPIANTFSDAALISDYYRKAASHRLGGNETEAIVQTWEYE